MSSVVSEMANLPSSIVACGARSPPAPRVVYDTRNAVPSTNCDMQYLVLDLTQQRGCRHWGDWVASLRAICRMGDLHGNIWAGCGGKATTQRPFRNNEPYSSAPSNSASWRAGHDDRMVQPPARFCRIIRYAALWLWFAAIDLTMPFLNGMIGGIALIQPSLCGGSLTTSYFVLTVLSLFLTVIAQPYNEAHDHMLNVIALILSCVSAGVALFSDDDVAVEVLDNVQMWLSVASIGISLMMLATSETCRAWLLRGLRRSTAPPAAEKVPAMQPSPPLATTKATIMDPPPKAAQRVTQRFPLEATAEVLEPLVAPDSEAMFELTEWEELHYHHHHHHHHQTMVQQHLIKENADQATCWLGCAHLSASIRCTHSVTGGRTAG